ncbi:MAG: hypothetical protein JF603_09300 [Acidobacteria bacterium]|nr:hypothetical protein [Acidobacteriota bacterium]
MTTRRRLSFALPLPLLLAAAAVWPVLRPEPPRAESAAEVAYRSLPSLPTGDHAQTQQGVEATAKSLAATLKSVPAVGADGDLCPADKLQVSWEVPGPTYTHGAYIEPLGPPPGRDTTKVNGIVSCEGNDFAYMGFEAHYTAGRWDVAAVPFLGDDEDANNNLPDEPAPDAAGTPATPDGSPTTAPRPHVTVPQPRTDVAFGGSIEAFAAYEPQRTCDASAKPGTLALRNLLLGQYDASSSLGIVRGCSVGGRSEHKEGRAFDWRVRVNNPVQKAEAGNFIGRLLATDAYGNEAALARRMGIMYVIWNRQIWSAYRAADGWRPYSGVSAHTDHVHISMSWAGALGRTSYWTGVVNQNLPQVAAATVSRSTKSLATTNVVARKKTTSAADAAKVAARRAEWNKHKAELAALDGKGDTADLVDWTDNQDGDGHGWSKRLARWQAELARRQSDGTSTTSVPESTTTSSTSSTSTTAITQYTREQLRKLFGTTTTTTVPRSTTTTVPWWLRSTTTTTPPSTTTSTTSTTTTTVPRSTTTTTPWWCRRRCTTATTAPSSTTTSSTTSTSTPASTSTTSTTSTTVHPTTTTSTAPATTTTTAPATTTTTVHPTTTTTTAHI